MAEESATKKVKTSESKQPTKISWGIIGCGSISRKWARAIQLAGHAVAAVASRSQAQAEAFARDNQLEGAKAYGSYLELLQDADVHAVLLTIPTSLRMQWVKQSLEHGKHVLMEKPHASAQQVGDMLRLASARGLQLMDGVMFMHAARLKEMETRIFQDNVLGGPPTRVMSMFSDHTLAPENIRSDPSLEPLGSLADLGTYNVRITLWAFQWELPSRVRAVATSRSAGGALTGAVGWLLYEDGRVGSFDANNTSAVSQWAHISGKTAVLKIPNFVVPDEAGCEYSVESTRWGRFDCGSTVETSRVGPHNQEAQAILTFAELAAKGETEPFWGRCAYRTQLVLDALMDSIDQGGQEIELNPEEEENSLER